MSDAINCTPVPEPVAEFVRDSIAPNSRRAYASDLSRFMAWGGSLPATGTIVSAYLAEHAETHAASSLTRWLTSLAKAHRVAGLPDPTKSELVRSVLRGIRRTRGAAPQQAKPLLRDDLFQVLDAMDGSLKARRDCALLLIGFAGGFRRSELVGLNVEDVVPVRQGIVLQLRRSKTISSVKGGRSASLMVADVTAQLQRLRTGSWLQN